MRRDTTVAAGVAQRSQQAWHNDRSEETRYESGGVVLAIQSITRALKHTVTF